MKTSPFSAAARLASAILLLSALQLVASAQSAQNDFLSAPEQDVLKELNLARTRPGEYAAYLERLRPLYKGLTYEPAPGKAEETQEGWAAVEEAISFLRASKPLPPLSASRGMCGGAGELVRDQSKSGATGHKGSDGSFCEARTMKFGAWSGPIGENLSYGQLSARDRVITLLIDDGFSSRGHRKRILDPAYTVAGVACGDHSTMGSMCVITIAGGFNDAATPKNAAPRPATPKAIRKP
jgi:uncharacterized protein YkwD